MIRNSIFFPLLLVALCFSAVADERFPDSNIQWILDQYQVSEPASLIPAKGLAGWTRNGGGEIAAPSKWRNQEGKIIFENSENTQSFQGGDIVTAKQYTNFVLDFVWIASQKCNSGIKYRLKNFGTTGARLANGWLGCEYQILDESSANADRGSTASLYHVFPPDKDKKKLNPHGQVNTGRIVVLDNHIEHWLNGEKVMQCEVGNESWKKAIAESKFSKEDGESIGFGENPTGFIMLQDHGGTITFEKIVIREIGGNKN